MQPVIYVDACQYVITAATQLERLERVGEMIDMLLTLGAAAAAGGKYDYEEYSMNDGQTQIRVRYRSAENIQKGLDALMNMEQKMLARLNIQTNGRVTRLVDISNFTGGCNSYR